MSAAMRVLVVVWAVVLVVATAVATPAAGPAAKPGGAILPSVARIAVDPGVRLKAEVYRGAGPGPHALIVVPGPLLFPVGTMAVIASRWAAAGYDVVAYEERGLLGSGGVFGMAGPTDVADASKVISWALRHTGADPRRVGMCGVSYGAGVSLLAAAADSRVRAVAAMAGWADTLETFVGGGTRRLQMSLFQSTIARLEARPSPDLRRAMADYFGSPEPTPFLREWMRVRSPMTYTDRLNAHGTRVLLAQTWSDGLQPPNQVIRFFGRLRGDNRLEFRPGDHGVAEGLALTGLPTASWTSAYQWLSRHLGGPRKGGGGPSVVLQPRGRFPRHPEEHYPSWRAATSRWLSPALGPSAGAHPLIHARRDSGANGGVIILSGALDQGLGLPPISLPALLPRRAAAVWRTAPAGRTQHLRGIPRLRTVVTPSASRGTFIAYLYDVGPSGIGKLITHAPYSFARHRPHAPRPVELELFATGYELPAGHRLALVIDGADPLYLSRNPAHATMSFDSAATRLSLPLR